MARRDISVGNITPRASVINAEKQVLGAQMPRLARFVPGYNPDLVISGSGGGFEGMKTPWFLPTAPTGLEDEYYIYDPPPETYGDIADGLEYNDGSGPQKLICDIKEGHVSRIPGVGNKPTRLRILLEKLVNEHSHTYTGPGGSEANVFYMLDEDDAVICVLHTQGPTFEDGDKWEIVQDLVLQHDEPITDIIEDPDAFHIKTAAEILLPDVIVGSNEDKLNGKAGYNIGEFSDAGLDIAGKRVLFLPDVGPLEGDVSKDATNSRLETLGQTGVLDLGGHVLSLSGDNWSGHLRVNGASDDSLAVSGNNVELTVQADNDNALNFTGSGFCVINGHVSGKDINCGSLALGGDISSEGGASFKQDVLIEADARVNNLVLSEGLELGGDIVAAGLTLTEDKPVDLGGSELVNSHTLQELIHGARARLNGNSSVVRLPHKDGLDVKDQDFGFQLTFRTAWDYSVESGVLLNKGVAGAAGYTFHLNDSNLLVFELSDGSSTVTVQSNKAVNDGRVHTAVVRGDRDVNLELWLDGVLQDDVKPCLSGFVANNEDLLLGRDNAGAAFFEGEVFVFRFWNELLTDNEARGHSSNPLRELDHNRRRDDYGPVTTEFNTGQDAASPDDVDSLGSWGGLTSESSLVFESQSDVISSSAYALAVNVDRPQDGSNELGIFKDMSEWGLVDGRLYDISFDWRHVGQQNIWGCWFSPIVGRSGNQLCRISSNQNVELLSDPVFFNVSVTSLGNGFTRVATTFSYSAAARRYLVFGENSSPSNGGIYLDNVICQTTEIVEKRFGCAVELTPSGLGQPGVWRDGSGMNNDGAVEAELILPERLIDFSDQPDRIILTASQQAQYADSDRILRYDQTDARFSTKKGVPVDTFATGDWIKIAGLETLENAHLYLKGDKLKIETERRFEILLGDMGEGIPYPVFIQGDDCLADLWVDKSMEELRQSLGDDKYAVMSNGLDQLENRRVIKNQGQRNRIIYNNEPIFSGHEPEARMGFSMPVNPYCLEWDNNATYDAAARSGDPSSNSYRCWFYELWQALDRRFNAPLPFPDSADNWLTVRPPPREAYFFRAPGTADADAPDRHSRAAWGVTEFIGAGTDIYYSQSGDTITLTDYQDHNIKKVRDGIRVQDYGGELPGGTTGTTIVRPGSIDRENYTFRLMNAETGLPVTALASGSLELDFSGMASGSTQTDAFQGHWHEFGLTGASLDNGVYTSVRYDYPDLLSIYFNNRVRDAVVDESGSGDPRTAAETRPQNMLIIPYYRL